MIHMKFGIQQFELEHKKYFFELISLPGFIGALSGTDTKGMYIVGHQDSRVIVLDPHYVQVKKRSLIGIFNQFLKLDLFLIVMFSLLNRKQQWDLKDWIRIIQHILIKFRDVLK